MCASPGLARCLLGAESVRGLFAFVARHASKYSRAGKTKSKKCKVRTRTLKSLVRIINNHIDIHNAQAQPTLENCAKL